jgi:hypothetical protein
MSANYDYLFLDKYDFIVYDNKILTKENYPHLGGMLEGGVIKNGTQPSKWVHLNAVNTICSLLEFIYNKRIDSGFDGSGSGYFDFIQDFFEVEIVTTDHCGGVIIANDAWLEGVIGLEFVGGIPRIWYAGKNLDLEGVTKNAKIIQIANFLASVGGMPSSLLPDLNPGILKFMSYYLNRGGSTARFLVESALFLTTDKTQQLHELAIHGALYLDEGFCPIKRDYYIPQFVWDNQINVVWKRHAAALKDNETRTIFIDKGGKEKTHVLMMCRDGGNTFYNKVY